MWTTETIGIAVGFGFYAGAFSATLICIFCVTVLSYIESRSRKELFVYIELEEIQITESIVDTMVSLKDPILHYEVFPPQSGLDGHVGIICRMSGDSQFIKLKDTISSYDVAMVIRTETK